jgi:hypothetical protein
MLKDTFLLCNIEAVVTMPSWNISKDQGILEKFTQVEHMTRHEPFDGWGYKFCTFWTFASHDNFLEILQDILKPQAV